MSGEDIITFAVENPWPPGYPPLVVRRFLTDYISSEKMIFDIHDHNGRLAVAVLLDKVANLANDACLEILGSRASVDPARVFFHFVDTAKHHVPDGRAGFQVGLSDRVVLDESEVTAAGLVHYYDTFRMVRPSLEAVGGESPIEIVDAVREDGDVVYEVLCRAFSRNPETSIPEEKTWKSNFLSAPESRVYLWKRDGTVLGFAFVVHDPNLKELDVSTIGVLPKARKLGIGHQLLMHSLREGEKNGHASAHLTVAVANAGALGLYERCGFSTVEKFRCYRVPK